MSLFDTEKIVDVDTGAVRVPAIPSQQRLWLMPQVAINWCICKGALPIPGAKNAKQAKEAAGECGLLMGTPVNLMGTPVNLNLH